MEPEECLVTINIYLYEPDNFYSVHTINKFDKYNYNSHVETNALAKSKKLLLSRWYYVFFPIYVHKAQCLALKMSNNSDFRIIHTN